jgi:hypothetical protein
MDMFHPQTCGVREGAVSLPVGLTIDFIGHKTAGSKVKISGTFSGCDIVPYLTIEHGVAKSVPVKTILMPGYWDHTVTAHWGFNDIVVRCGDAFTMQTFWARMPRGVDRP